MKSLVLVTLLIAAAATAAPIDRQAVVQRHDPHLQAIDPMAPLGVGTGASPSRPT